jgi:serine/threonine-protein kinase SRPK3
MLSLRRWLPPLGRRVAWEPLDFDKAATSFPTISSTQRIDEETIPDYVASRYYPARIGEVLGGRYQIVGKLGFGASSTAWLARDLR